MIALWIRKGLEQIAGWLQNRKELRPPDAYYGSWISKKITLHLLLIDCFNTSPWHRMKNTLIWSWGGNRHTYFQSVLGGTISQQFLIQTQSERFPEPHWFIEKEKIKENTKSVFTYQPIRNYVQSKIHSDKTDGILIAWKK